MKLPRRSFLKGLIGILPAAAVRAELPTPVKNEPLQDFSFDSFNPPDEMQYQWCARTVMAEAESCERLYKKMIDRGWRPVPASRHNIKGDKIELDGQVLMERPQKVSNIARQREIDAAHKMVTDWEKSMKDNGFEVSVRYTNGPFEYWTVSDFGKE